MSPKKRALELAREVRAYCEANADAANAGKYARYFKEGYDAWGLLDKEHEFWHARQEAWESAYADLGLAGFLAAGEELVKSGKFEEGSMAIRFLKPYVGELDAAAAERLGRWFDGGIRNWAHVDALCGEVLGPALVAGPLRLEALAPWRKAADRFQRRAAAVASLALVKPSKAPGALLRHLDPLMRDKERVVQQGVGWVLREIWKRWPEPAEAFLLKWKDEAGRVIVQYATERMTAESRQRFKRGKLTIASG